MNIIRILDIVENVFPLPVLSHPPRERYWAESGLFNGLSTRWFAQLIFTPFRKNNQRNYRVICPYIKIQYRIWKPLLSQNSYFKKKIPFWVSWATSLIRDSTYYILLMEHAIQDHYWIFWIVQLQMLVLNVVVRSRWLTNQHPTNVWHRSTY